MLSLSYFHRGSWVIPPMKTTPFLEGEESCNGTKKLQLADYRPISKLAELRDRCRVHKAALGSIQPHSSLISVI